MVIFFFFFFFLFVVGRVLTAAISKRSPYCFSAPVKVRNSHSLVPPVTAGVFTAVHSKDAKGDLVYRGRFCTFSV